MIGELKIDREYIRHNFSEILGKDVALLNEPDGLDKIQAKVRKQLADLY